MKPLYPNASLLILITRTDPDGREALLFLHKKILPDVCSSSGLHWYDGFGRNGKAKTLWSELSIREWCVRGTDEEIGRLFDDLVGTHCLRLSGKELPLKLPENFRMETADDRSDRRGEEAALLYKADDNRIIPCAFYQKQNLDALTGHATGGDIKALYPPGIYDEGFLPRNIGAGIWGVKERRRPYVAFRGTRESSEKGVGSKTLIGFCQQPSPDADTCEILDESERVVGKGAIDPASGLFRVEANEPVKKGFLRILRGGEELIRDRFVLLQDIRFSVEMANTMLTDAYGRTFLLGENDRKRPPILSSFTWQEHVYANPTDACTALSDRIKEILDYLGPDILIADPYYLGALPAHDTTGSFDVNASQIAFLNALVHSAWEKGLSSLAVLGCGARAKRFAENTRSDRGSTMVSLFDRYEEYFNNLLRKNLDQKILPTGSIIFHNSAEDFHNRYWFSVAWRNGKRILEKCVIVTNSISRMIETDAIPVTNQNQQNQIIRKYSELLAKAELKLTL